MKLITLNKLQETKIRLAYFAWKDIMQLSKLPHSCLLEYVWDSTKDEMCVLFNQAGESFQEIVDAFRACEFTLYPKMSMGFDAHTKFLIINLWSWMFRVLSNTQQSEVGFVPLFFNAVDLAHEYQHYNYLRKSNILGASETELDDFSKQHRGKMEEIALKKQINILKRYKNVAPPEISIITFKVTSWKNDGKCTIKPKEYRLLMKGLIDRFVQQYENAIDLVKKDTSGSKYTEESDKKDAKINKEISMALNLPIDVNLDEAHYKRVAHYFCPRDSNSR